MIKIYGMSICPDCVYVDEQVKGNSNFEIIDLAEKTSNLKEFLKIRDNSSLFDSVRASGGIGIPCFVLEDGTVTLTPEEVGLKSRPQEEEAKPVACSLDRKGC